MVLYSFISLITKKIHIFFRQNKIKNQDNIYQEIRYSSIEIIFSVTIDMIIDRYRCQIISDIDLSYPESSFQANDPENVPPNI